MIKTEDFLKIYDLFLSKGWSLNLDNQLGNVFNNFLIFFSNLSGEEKHLIELLSLDFEICDLQKSSCYLDEIFKTINLQKNSYDNLFIMPIMPVFEAKQSTSNIWHRLKLIANILKNGAQEKNRTAEDYKSGERFIYEVQHALVPKYFSGKSFRNIKSLRDLNILKDIYADRGSTVFIFIDDFIGSGNTADKFLEKFKTTFFKEGVDEVYIISIVMQKDASQRLKTKFPFTITTGAERGKGITDSLRVTDKPKALDIMRKLEIRIGVDRKYRFGYKKSEALISFLRTPNNTFPIFWFEHDKENNERRRPFYR